MISIGIVGGSNTLLRDGYVAHLQEYLATQHGIAADAPINRAIGGTQVFSGLGVLCQTKLHEQVDVLLIEYTLNDSAGFLRRPDLYDHWARGYEGLVRRAMTDNPRLAIVPVILGQKTGPHRRRICTISAGVRQIATRYALECADMNEETAARFVDQLAYEALYADESHFTRPEGARLVAELIAAKIAAALRAMAAPRRTIDQILPIYADNFAKARYLSRPDLFFTKPPPKKNYRNSGFGIDTWVLEPDNAMTFSIVGRVLLIDFVSTQSSATLKIGLRGKTYLQNTTRRSFLKYTNFKFLVGTILPERHGRYAISGNRDRVTIEIADAEAIADDETETRDEAAAPLMPPIEADNPSFSLIGMLYVGMMKPVAKPADASPAPMPVPAT